MGTFINKRRGLHLWLVLSLALLGLYYLLRGNRDAVNALVFGFIGPLEAFFGRVWSAVPWSMMEVFTALGVLAAAGYILFSLRAVLRARGERWDRAYGAILGAACAAVTLADAFCLLWGACFWCDSFQDRSGLYAEEVAYEDLYAVTELFARETARAAESVPRDGTGLFAVPREEILAAAPEIYAGAEELYPFLAFQDTGVKPMAFSRLMSRMDFTGFYCSYTGEANVNVDSPACLLPSTIAHEMAHQRMIASEQECNFLAVLASTASSNPAYVYSGFLMGYIYLGNALYAANPQAFYEIRALLPETVVRDLQDNSAYWDQFRDTVTQTVSNKVYDGLLKSYGDERGIRSYGTVVDLLVACYRPR